MLGAIPVLRVQGENGAMDGPISMNAHTACPPSSARCRSRSCPRCTAAGAGRIPRPARRGRDRRCGGVDPRPSSLVVGVALWLSALWITRHLGSASAHSEAEGGSHFPSRAVLLIGGLCFLAMTEGADRRLERHLSPSHHRYERRRGSHRIHRLLARNGRRAARRRPAQRAPRRRLDAGARRAGARSVSLRRRAARSARRCLP